MSTFWSCLDGAGACKLLANGPRFPDPMISGVAVSSLTTGKKKLVSASVCRNALVGSTVCNECQLFIDRPHPLSGVAQVGLRCGFMTGAVSCVAGRLQSVGREL